MSRLDYLAALMTSLTVLILVFKSFSLEDRIKALESAVDGAVDSSGS